MKKKLSFRSRMSRIKKEDILLQIICDTAIPR